MPQFQQVLDRKAQPTRVIRHDLVDRQVNVPVQRDQRQPRGCQCLEHSHVRLVVRHKHQPVTLPLRERSDQLHLALEAFAAVRYVEQIAYVLQRVLGCARDYREEWVRNIGNHEADCMRDSGPHASGHVVGSKSQLCNRPPHCIARVRTDGFAVIDDARDSSHRDTCA